MSAGVASILGVLAISFASPTSDTVVVTRSAEAAESDPVCLGDVCFDGVTVLGDQEVPLRGAGTLRWFTFKVYHAALYAPENARDVLAPVPKRLTLHYLRPIDREDIIEASWEALRSNPQNDIPALRMRLERFHDLVINVREGDRYDMIHLPGRGLVVLFNEEYVDFVEGDDFARAYLGIWLSEATVKESLRKRLLDL